MNIGLNNSIIRQGRNGVYKNPFTSAPNFTGSAANTFQKIITNDSVKYTNANKIVSTIDDIMGGDKMLRQNLNGANIKIYQNTIELEKTPWYIDVYKTMTYPFKDMWLDMATALFKTMRKSNFFDSFAQKMLNTTVLSEHAKKVNTERSLETVTALLDQFSKSAKAIDIDISDKTSTTITQALKSCEDGFKDSRCAKITKIAKNYKSRDERTLNRIATATVSALLSGIDFYNLSMLQKDDAQDAVKARNGRIKQETTRMAMSAGMTFVTLGALEKYIKGSVTKYAAVIAGSALVTEVLSRWIHGTPLKPLTPDKAAEIAKNKKRTNNPTQYNIENLTEQNTSTVNTGKKDLYSQFNQKNSFTSLDKTQKEEQKEAPKTDKKDKKSGIRKGLLTATTIASIIYVASGILKGKYSSMQYKKEILEKNRAEIEAFIKGEPVKQLQQLEAAITECFRYEKESAKNFAKFNFFKNTEKRLMQKSYEVDLGQLESNIKKLRNSDETYNVSKLLNNYIKHINYLKEQDGNILRTTVETDRLVPKFLACVMRGFGKLFDNVYSILSLPAKAVEVAVIENKYKTSNAIMGEAMDLLNKKNGTVKGVEAEIAELSRLFDKYKNNAKELDADRKIAQIIEKRTRNLEEGAETGDIAALSRTLVTIISSYFFVNDYRNKVLIESEGKDTIRASEVTKERIGHKLSNFVINGTLMNVANTLFIRPLNSSLLAATVIAAGTEICNELGIRKVICQPAKEMESRDEIIKYEQEQLNKGGILGAWARTFKKLTGKKSLTEQAGISTQEQK